MADKVYATLKISGTIKVLVRGDSGTDYGTLLTKLMADVSVYGEGCGDCDVEILDSAIVLSDAEITDAK